VAIEEEVASGELPVASRRRAAVTGNWQLTTGN
jgi:hypothetical protein